MNEAQLVSVIIAVHQWRDYVNRAVQSAIRQGAVIKEIIVVDNSNDSVAKERLEFARHPLIKILESPVRLNAVFARNYGIEFASGTYIAILDSDDEYLPSHIESQLKTIRLDTKIDMVFSSYLNVVHERVEILRRVRSERVTLKGYILFPSICHSTVLFKKSSFCGYKDVGTRHDFASWITMLRDGKVIAGNPHVGVKRHQRTDSYSSVSKRKLMVKQWTLARQFSGLTSVCISWLFFLFAWVQIFRFIKERSEVFFRK